MSFLVGLISLVVLAVAVPVVVRVSPRRNAIGILVGAALIIHVAGVIVGASVLAELDYWQCASLYWFATVIMIYAYGTCYRSLSVQMLLVVARTGSRAIGVEPLYDQHFKGFISDRIDALVEGGRAEFRDGRIVITPRGRSGAELISRARRVFALRESRLYFTKADPMETA